MKVKLFKNRSTVMPFAHAVAKSLHDGDIIPVKVTLDIFRSLIEFESGSRKYPG